MTTLSHDDVATLWVQLGGPRVFADRAAAQAQAESGGRLDATHDNGSSVDRGLFQINSVHGASSSYAVDVNIRAAIAISHQGANWRPWCTAWSDNACGTKGGSYEGAGASYKHFLTGRFKDSGIRIKHGTDGALVLWKNGKNVETEQGRAGGDAGAGGDAVPQGITGGAATGVAKGVAHAALSVGEFLALLTQRGTWVRVLYVLGGLVLVVLAAFLLDKALMAQVAGTAVTNVVGAVAKHAI